MQNKVNEVTVSTDVDTLNKIRGKLKPTDSVELVDKNVSTTSTPVSSLSSMKEEEAVIEPQDPATIKYLSNVKDKKTGEVSKPFTIADKRYQMVRGIFPSQEVVMAVYCLDDVDENGENIIHPKEYFEENIVKPFHESTSKENEVTSTDGIKQNTIKEEPKTAETNKSLKLGEFKHFLIDTKTGKVRKFKKSEELAKANMSETEKYMNLSQFKKHVDETLFGNRQRAKMREEEQTIKPDVQIAIDQMVQKVKPYINKINEPIEKIQFIVKLTTMIQLETSKYPLLMAELKKASDSSFGGTNAPTNTTITQTTSGIAENKVISKDELIESLTKTKVIRTVKVKDVK